MEHVRPAVPEDIPQIAELYSRVFDAPVGLDGLRSALYKIFFGHPWIDNRFPSLVYQAEKRIVGCLGVMPRPMSMKGRPVRAVISHTFMVDRNTCATLAGVELIRALLSGRQDVLLAQSSSQSRRIFEAVGGSTSLLQSLGWTGILQPTRYALSFLKRHGLHPAVSAALAPLCRVVDVITGQLPPNPFRLSVPGLSGEELGAETLAMCVSEFSRDRALQPTYDVTSLRWLLDLLARQNGEIALRKVLVRDAARQIVGSYLYYSHPTGVADVIQIAARPTSTAQVIDHLFSDAQRRGLLAVSGQMDPHLMRALTAKHCLFNCGSWLLVHSRHPEIVAAIHRGDAFLTRLEAEWWISSVLIRSLTPDTATGQPWAEGRRSIHDNPRADILSTQPCADTRI